VAAFLEVKESSFDWFMMRDGPTRGTLKPTGLGAVESMLESNGVKVAQRHWIVAQGNSPEDDIQMGMVFVLGSIPLGLMGFWFSRWMARRE
jgi:hypothetical protein